MTCSYTESRLDKPTQLSKPPETDEPSPSSSSYLARDNTASHSQSSKSSRISRRFPEASSSGQGVSICETLRAELPSYDSIIKVALAHKDWWVRIHRAVRGMYDGTIESFPDFVRRVYTSDQPSEIGKMAIAFAFSSDIDGSHIYALVDRLVVSNMTYMSTVEGLECLILLAVLYADEGQPKRSWMIYRRGVLVSQLTVRQHLISETHARKLMTLTGPVPGWPPVHSQATSMACHLPSRPHDEPVPRPTLRSRRHASQTNPRSTTRERLREFDHGHPLCYDSRNGDRP